MNDHYDNGNESSQLTVYIYFNMFTRVLKLFWSCFEVCSKYVSCAFLPLPPCETMTAGVATQRRGPGKYRLFGNNQHVIHQGDAHTEYQSALVAEGLDRGLTAAQIFLVHGGRVVLTVMVWSRHTTEILRAETYLHDAKHLSRKDSPSSTSSGTST